MMRILLLLMILMTGRLQAQTLERQVAATAGNSVKLPALQIDFTVGEPVVLPVTGSGILLTQGFQQPFVFVLKSNEVFPFLHIYPNPTYGNTIAHFALPASGNLTITVHNTAGQLILAEKATYAQGETQYVIKTANLIAGIYFLTVNLEGYGTVTKKLIRINK